MSRKVSNVKIVVLSGPSGSGKSTIVDRLVEEAPVKLIKAVSATTRPPREGEVDGADYYFLSDEEFQRRRENDELLECAEVFGAGYWYGTLKSELERIAAHAGWAFLEIDVEGALNIMEEHPEAVTIFLTTPSENEYERRLRGRGTESEEVIARRLQTARQELRMVGRYRHRVVNDDLEQAVREISEILSTREVELHA
ncbi:MAG: guanylate kinase [Planctomycetaceae bacterium]|nr:guanylate kinase [Planctomycetaceae bacterium]